MLNKRGDWNWEQIIIIILAVGAFLIFLTMVLWRVMTNAFGKG